MKDFLIHKQDNMIVKLQVKESDDTNPLANKFYWNYVAYNERKRKNANYYENKIRALADMSSTKSPTLLENG